MESRILAMSINPYFANEAVMLLEDGSLKCWTDGQLNLIGDNDIINYCTENEICWINCIYGSHPRSLLFIHSEEASIYDMRVWYFCHCLVIHIHYFLFSLKEQC